MKALTVKQPWAWGIAHGGKTVENRSWPTRHTGLLAIHAGASWDSDGSYDRRVIDAAVADTVDGKRFDPPLAVEIDGKNIVRVLARDARYTKSAIVAVATLTGWDLCNGSCSPWAVPGEHHWQLANVRALAEPVPCKGQLGLWDLPADVEAAVRGQLGAALVSPGR